MSPNRLGQSVSGASLTLRIHAMRWLFAIKELGLFERMIFSPAVRLFRKSLKHVILFNELVVADGTYEDERCRVREFARSFFCIAL